MDLSPAGPSHSPSAQHLSLASGSGTGTLRTKISLKQGTLAVVPPFALMKPDLPPASAVTGGTNLLNYYELDQAYSRFSGAKKVREELSSFLPHLPGNIGQASQNDDSSLKSLIEKPPIVKEIVPFSSTALSGFRLHPGQIPEAYRLYGSATSSEARKKKKKHKRSLEDADANREESTEAIDKKGKKQRKEEDKEKRKKKKKEKKKKKSSPTP